MAKWPFWGYTMVFYKNPTRNQKYVVCVVGRRRRHPLFRKTVYKTMFTVQHKVDAWRNLSGCHFSLNALHSMAIWNIARFVLHLTGDDHPEFMSALSGIMTTHAFVESSPDRSSMSHLSIKKLSFEDVPKTRPG